MSTPVKRLAVYNLQHRDPSFSYTYPWAVCEAPIPEFHADKDIETFKTLPEAMDFAYGEIAHAAEETP